MPAVPFPTLWDLWQSPFVMMTLPSLTPVNSTILATKMIVLSWCNAPGVEMHAAKNAFTLVVRVLCAMRRKKARLDR